MYMYGVNRWESNVTSGIHKTAAAAVLPLVYAAYTMHFRRSTRLSSRVSHVTFPTVVVTVMHLMPHYPPCGPLWGITGGFTCRLRPGCGAFEYLVYKAFTELYVHMHYFIAHAHGCPTKYRGF